MTKARGSGPPRDDDAAVIAAAVQIVQEAAQRWEAGARRREDEVTLHMAFPTFTGRAPVWCDTADTAVEAPTT